MAFGQLVRRLFGLESKGLTIEHIEENFYPQGTTATGSLGIFGQAVGDGLASNVLVAPVLWVCRNFTEAQPLVQRRTNAVWEPFGEHPLDALMDQPNPFYGGDELWQASAMSFVMHGEAFWYKVRSAYGDVLQLWYVPNFCITPRFPFDGSNFIDYYDYLPGTGRALRLPRRDVVHFRMGLDPNDLRRGFSPLKSLLREVATDDEASAFSAHILRNMGVPGLLISPKDAASVPTPEDMKTLKQYVKTEFTGSKRGGTMVMGKPTSVEQFGLDPSKLMVAALRDVSEERVCAMLGIPAAVVGFGSGNESTKVGATLRELRRLAFVNCLAPNQNIMAKQVTRQLLHTDFVAQRSRFRVIFDQSGVAAFAEDENLKTERICRKVQTGVLRIDRAQEALGDVVDPNMKVYLRPTNSLAVDEHGDPIAPPAGPSAPNPPALDPALAPKVPDGVPEPPAADGKGDQDLLAAIAARRGLSGNGDGA